jgi:hypothetical protein
LRTPESSRAKAAARESALATNIQRQSSAPFQIVSRLQNFAFDEAKL